MKILHVIPSLGIGGTEKVLLQVCRALESKSLRHAVVALKVGGATEESLKRIPIPVRVLNSSNSFWSGILDFPRLYSDLKEIIAEVSPEIVHTWLSRANILGRFTAKQCKVPHLISSLRVMEEEKSYHLWAERFTEKWCDLVTVNSPSLEKFALEKIGIPKGKVIYIPNGIDCRAQEIDQSKVSFFKKEWIKENEVVIGTMGRLHFQKGIDIFLKAAKIVAEKIPNVKFLIAGDGPEKESLMQLSHALGIESKVQFCGWVKENASFLSLLQIFVLTSRWEGMPNVILEAMALKKAIVATKVGGTLDLIEHEKEGLLVKSNDPEPCAQAIFRFLQESSLTENFSQSAYQKVQQKFSLDKMIDSYRALYETFSK
ncbi:MAG: glycosyltransferase [Elusimicrobia bacterium]|nr:glycosyltransferase [Elusimicrobiota bacterium]